MSNATAVVVRKKTWERRLDAAKKKHRPKLQDWSRDRFQSARNHEFQSLKNLTCPPLQLQTDGGSQSALHNLINGSIDRIPCSELSIADFIELYEKPYKPCIITNIPSCEGWSVDSSWSPRELKNRFGDSYFKVGEDDDGYKVKVRFKYFYQYMKHNLDDSPLYLFDGNFDQDITSKSLLGDYKVPSYFTDDLLGLVGEERRPPYRWFVVGPERSGSEVHVDPLGTSAWNTVVVGRKRWVLFPPGTPKRIAKGLDVLAKGEDDEAINYFVDLLPRIKRIHRHVVSPIEFIQEAGETVFVPGGWWHGVLNVESSVAITQVQFVITIRPCSHAIVSSLTDGLPSAYFLHRTSAHTRTSTMFGGLLARVEGSCPASGCFDWRSTIPYWPIEPSS